MKMRMMVMGVGVSVMAVACGTTAEDGAASADELKASKGYAYECTTSSGAPVSVTVTEKYLQYDEEEGEEPNRGERVKSGGPGLRYQGFETGADCGITIVADEALLKGAAKGTVHFECTGDDNWSDEFSCSKPKRASLKDDSPVVAPGPDFSKAKAWSCTTTSAGPLLQKSLEIETTPDAIRVATEDGDYSGTRDLKYKPRTGDWIRYNENSEYGGDCAMSFVLEGSALTSAKTTTLKVRCSGDDFFQDLYTCKAQ